MPGEVLECLKCRHQMRWGFPSHAIAFAQSKRPHASEHELIDDFFAFNPSILREKPVRCNQCHAEQGLLKVIHTYE